VHAALREQVVAALTHDLRNPLGVASVAIQLILRHTDSPLIKDLATKAGDNLERLDKMTRSLLDSMVFRSGQRLHLTLSHFDIVDVILDVCDQATIVYGPRFDIIGGAVTGWWDRDAVKRVVENLLSNAVKHGAPDTPIRIKITGSHERLALSVHNEGKPIPPEEMESIFLIFERSQAAKENRQKGWGIGLPYVRAVAESHGGSVSVDSSAERGTSFIFNVPVDARPFQHAPTIAQLP
jgi:signal transduction histidine kinase